MTRQESSLNGGRRPVAGRQSRHVSFQQLGILVHSLGFKERYLGLRAAMF